jgi:hypothetical protein
MSATLCTAKRHPTAPKNNEAARFAQSLTEISYAANSQANQAKFVEYTWCCTYWKYPRDNLHNHSHMFKG